MNDRTDARLLTGGLGATDTDLLRLTERLSAAAADAALLDVAYDVVETPLGSLLLAATARGLVRVAFAGEGHARVLDALAASLGARVLRAPERLAPVAAQLGEYLEGRRRTLAVTVDLALVRGQFRRAVIEYLPHIGYGETATYTAVATAVGSPRAVRAVGTACAMNPLPLVLPCHRVVRTDGAIGNYLGGTEAKRRLLELEAA